MAVLAMTQQPPVQDVRGLNESSNVFTHLQDRGYIAFHPRLAKEFGYKAAIMLGLSLYWMRKSLTERPRSQGWFYMTGAQWTASTALGRREIESVRAALLDAGVMEEKLQGSPPVKHYRIQLSAMAELLGESSPSPSLEMAQGWFRYSVSYYKPLADLAGSPACGLYLSYLLCQQRNALRQFDSQASYLKVTQRELSEALYLGPWAQRNAREKLKQAGFIQESDSGSVHINTAAIVGCLKGQTIEPIRKRLPRKAKSSVLASEVSLPYTANKHTQSNGELPGLETTQRQQSLSFLSPSQSKTVRDTQLVPTRPCGDIVLGFLATAQRVGNRQIGLTHVASSALQNKVSIPEGGAENAKFKLMKTPNRLDENAKLKLMKTPNPITKGITNTTTTKETQHVPSKPIVDNFDGRRSRRVDSNASKAQRPLSAVATSIAAEAKDDVALIYPGQLANTSIASINDVLSKAPHDMRQAMLDELQGQLLTPGKTIHNPAGWLMGLLKEILAGRAVFALAEQVANLRQRKTELEARQQAARNDIHRTPAVADSAMQSSAEHESNDAVKQETLAKLAALKKQWRTGQ